MFLLYLQFAAPQRHPEQDEMAFRDLPTTKKCGRGKPLPCYFTRFSLYKNSSLGFRAFSSRGIMSRSTAWA